MRLAPLVEGAVQAEDVTVPEDGPRAFSVALHDVAFASQDACVRLAERLDHIGPLPLTLLISPRWHRKGSDPRFDRWIESRLARGDVDEWAQAITALCEGRGSHVARALARARLHDWPRVLAVLRKRYERSMQRVTGAAGVPVPLFA